MANVQQKLMDVSLLDIAFRMPNGSDMNNCEIRGTWNQPLFTGCVATLKYFRDIVVEKRHFIMFSSSVDPGRTMNEQNDNNY